VVIDQCIDCKEWDESGKPVSCSLSRVQVRSVHTVVLIIMFAALVPYISEFA